jgi:hypothetical protein
MPLSEADKQQIGAFLGALIRGEGELGWSALPMVKLYNAAKQEKVNIPDLLVRDPESTRLIVAALKSRAKMLPINVLKQIEAVVVAAKS